jgi:hypothetical protein
MARTNLHELANVLLERLAENSSDGMFEGRLREVASEAGLNSVRSAEAIKILEDTGRIEVVQRGRRGRDTVISINSTEPLTIEDAEAMLPSRTAKKSRRLNYDDLGKAVVERLLELARNDGLRAAQVDAFALENDHLKHRVKELEETLGSSSERESDLRIELKGTQEALERAEENLRRAVGAQDREDAGPPRPVGDDDTQAVLDVLRSRW